MVDKKFIVIMGPPASGKTTQAELLANKMGLPFVSTGNLLRELSSHDQLPKRYQKMIDQGKMLPTEVTVSLLKKYIKQIKAEQTGYVGEGFPREINQAKKLQPFITQVIYLNISDSIAIQRLSTRKICPSRQESYNFLTKKPKIIDRCDQCGHKLVTRGDDQPQAIKQRLQTFHQETQPVLSHFKKLGILEEIDGSQVIAEIAQQIWEKVNQ